jgi:hypothetical protein
MEILGKLLGGVHKVKIMRLFLLNPENGFEVRDVAERCRTTTSNSRRAVLQLSAMDFIKKKQFVKEIKKKNNKIVKKKVEGWSLNADFPYINELKQLLVEGDFFKHEELSKRFKGKGKINLLVVSGIFIQNSESRLDLLIVGDNLKKNAIQKTISVLESELGKELAYAIFETPEFKYRVSMYDKLLRDVFDFQHEALITSKEFSTTSLLK